MGTWVDEPSPYQHVVDVATAQGWEALRTRQGKDALPTKTGTWVDESFPH
jgi:hypothetical protein